MPVYQDLTIGEGREFLPKVQNLFFMPLREENFFVEPWSNRELRDCAEFRLGTGTNGAHEILFFVADEAMINFLESSPGELYLFGAYNQVHVCQMRARGKVTLQEEHPETEAIKERLQAAIAQRIDTSISKLHKSEAEERYRILACGRLFRFDTISYAYASYMRG
jgi:hypothetical protein